MTCSTVSDSTANSSAARTLAKPPRRIRRHQVGHVARHENFSLFRVHQQGRIDGGIGAGDDRGIGASSLPQLFEQFALLAEILFPEAPKTGDETGDVLHEICLLLNGSLK
jgi:hypothetical protein